jgi:pyruvate/2-oxoglutarate dehydrogenase complex dihydrolipoamide acyltransferase (E2) component
MNYRAGGNQNGRGASSDRVESRVESTDALDTKELAASVRSASPPAPRARPQGLSGMVGRRDSVVGLRIHETPPRAPGLAWFWVAAGCLSVLVPGLGGIWYVSRPSTTPAIAIHTPNSSAAAVAPPTGETVEIRPIAHEAILEAAPEPAAEPARKATKSELATAKAEAKAERAARRHSGEAKRAAADDATASAAGAAADDSDQSEVPREKAERAEKADRTEKAAEKAEAPASAKSAEKAEAPAEEAPEEPASGSPKTVKELKATLGRLQSKVGLCHNRFQIDGVANVGMMISPSGTVESIQLKGEFEGTPTGDCIVRQLSSASFPSFDGTDAVRISRTFSLE